MLMEIKFLTDVKSMTVSLCLKMKEDKNTVHIILYSIVKMMVWDVVDVMVLGIVLISK